MVDNPTANINGKLNAMNDATDSSMHTMNIQSAESTHNANKSGALDNNAPDEEIPFWCYKQLFINQLM